MMLNRADPRSCHLLALCLTYNLTFAFVMPSPTGIIKLAGLLPLPPPASGIAGVLVPLPDPPDESVMSRLLPVPRVMLLLPHETLLFATLKAFWPVLKRRSAEKALPIVLTELSVAALVLIARLLLAR